MSQVTFLQSELREQRKVHKSEIENLRHQMETLQQFTILCNRTNHEGMQQTRENISSLADNISHLKKSLELNGMNIYFLNKSLKNFEHDLSNSVQSMNTMKQSISFEIQQEFRQNRRDIVNNITTLGNSVDIATKQNHYISLSLNDVRRDLRHLEQHQENNSLLLDELQKNITESNEMIVNIDRKTNDSRNREMTTNLAISEMQTKIQYLETDVNARISFTAGRTQTKQNWTIGEKIVFTDVIDSQGGGYNARTGIFTVPQNGTYLFFCNILTYANHTFNADIFVNGQSKERIVTNAYGVPKAIASSNLLIIRLKPGDQVDIRLALGSHLLSDWAHEVVFSGIKVK
ncbi:uncharacterized protein LOC134228501 [Saccostrea cucullata]|uniref:uncharacterized protein LOC134228501 n=1 Tax=Saccostrea cuccullata TaxID=36930 RepID=UPI002ED5FB3F